MALWYAPLLLLLQSGEAPPPLRVVTDREIAAFAAHWDRYDTASHKRVLGLHHGVRVVVDYPCSDLCPQYKTRIIHYDGVWPGAACDAIGGVVRVAMVPRGIGARPNAFCVPAVLGTKPIPLGGG